MIGAGASIIGSLLGRKKKQEEVVNRVDYARMVKDAEAAGFNPLTALRNGGAAGFSITSQPVLSHAGVGEAIANAGNSIGNFISNFDPFEDKMREVQYRTMQEQLRGLQLDNSFKSRSRIFDVPAVSGRRQVTAGPSLGQAAPVASWFDLPAKTEEALPIWVPGVDRDGKRVWIPNPDGPDIEQLAFGLAARTQSGWEAAARTAGQIASDPGGQVKSRPLTDAEKKEREGSWLPSWVPTFGISWN